MNIIHRCETCGAEVRVVGGETKHYEPVAEAAIERIKKWIVDMEKETNDKGDKLALLAFLCLIEQETGKQ